MRRFHVRRVVEAADESISGHFDRALDVAVAPQAEVRQPAFARSHAQLHRDARRRHRQIKGVLKLDLLRLRQPERARDVCKRLARESDRARPHTTHRADERHVFNRMREPL